jgi:hypothetical protein
MKDSRSESGQVLVLTALCMTAFLGFMALAIDAGLLFRAKRNLQIAADAAATAGALDWKYNGNGTKAVAAAKAASAANGVTDGAGGVVVTASYPPVDGPNTGSTGFVEVIIRQPNPTFFMKLFGFANVNVGARAVAGSPGVSNACVIVLNPTASGSMTLQGSFDVSAPKCGVVVDSKDPDALQFTGAGGTLVAGSVSVVGGDGGQVGDSTPAPLTGAAPGGDPLNVSGPTPSNGGCSSVGDSGTPQVTGSTDTTTTKLTGSYAGPGINKAICFTKNVNLNNVTLGTGIYVFENGVTTNGTITSGVGGTTIDIQGGSFSVNTGTVLALVAPQNSVGQPPTWETNGIALMEPSTNSNQITIQKGDASGSLDGIIYAPSAQLYLQDSGGDKSGGLSLTTDLIVNELFDKTATLSIASYSQSTPTTPLTRVSLVE